MAQTVKLLPTIREIWVRSPGRKDHLEKAMEIPSVLLPGKSHGWRSLVGYSPWGCKVLYMTEQLYFTSGPIWGFPGGSVVKNLPVNTGDTGDVGFIPRVGRSGGEHSNSFQPTCLDNTMGRGAWWARVHSFLKSQTQLKQLSTHTLIHNVKMLI